MNVLKGKPLKAFIYQDHEAHIKVHQSAMTDPIVQQLIGQNPQAQLIMAAMQAHIAEHVGYAYRAKIEQALGVALPNPDDELPEEMEQQISRMMAEAAPQVLAQSQALMAQQQAQQNAQDPVIQMQMQELQIKKQDSDTKAKKVQIDAATKMEELKLKREAQRSQRVQKGVDSAITATKALAEQKLKEQTEAVKAGVSVAQAQTQHLAAKNKPTKGSE
jgi:hypothetical protein